MHDLNDGPRALFLSGHGALYPDNIICSGILPPQLEGQHCPYSDQGRMPYPQRLVEIETYARPQIGRTGEFAPPCAIEQLGSLAAWGKNSDLGFPLAFVTLRIFKCRQMFLLIVPGLHHDHAHEWVARF